MPKLNEKELDKMLDEISKDGLYKIEYSPDDCKIILNDPSVETVKNQKSRVAALLKELATSKQMNENQFQILIKRVKSSANHKAAFLNFINYGQYSDYEKNEKTFADAFTYGYVGVEASKNDKNMSMNAASSLSKTMGELKVDYDIRTAYSRNNDAINLIISGMTSKSRLSLKDEFREQSLLEIDNSVDFVGYTKREAIILSFVGEDLSDEQYSKMLSNIRQNPRLRNLLIFATMYINSAILEKQIDNLKTAFTKAILEPGSFDLDRIEDTACCYVESALIARQAKLENKEKVNVLKEQNVIGLNIARGYKSKDDIFDRAIFDLIKDSSRKDISNIDKLREQYDRVAWENEEQNNYKNKLIIFMSFVAASLDDEEFEIFALAVQNDVEARKIVDE
ncbi:MAG: hypothetical protein K5656_02865, partial [Lachnospiraceae bacterium]|nr:hypothetical protein [Lachnospiraceae bacterium]